MQYAVYVLDEDDKVVDQQTFEAEDDTAATQSAQPVRLNGYTGRLEIWRDSIRIHSELLVANAQAEEPLIVPDAHSAHVYLQRAEECQRLAMFIDDAEARKQLLDLRQSFLQTATDLNYRDRVIRGELPQYSMRLVDHSGNPVAAQALWAESETEAVTIASVVGDACSDYAADWELRTRDREIPLKHHRTPERMAELREHTQQLVVDCEIAFHDVLFQVGESKKLIEKINSWSDALYPDLSRYYPDLPGILEDR